MTTKMLMPLRVAAVVVAVLFGSLSVTSVAAQDTDEVTDATEPVTDTAEDDGFDDWGLLGLLGLAGLAGLRKRPEPEVRTVDRPVDTRR